MSSHPEALAVGSYVVGALRDPERAAFVEHLRGCAECRAEVDRLAVLPELLALVPPYVAAALVDVDHNRATGGATATPLDRIAEVTMVDVDDRPVLSGLVPRADG